MVLLSNVLFTFPRYFEHATEEVPACGNGPRYAAQLVCPAKTAPLEALRRTIPLLIDPVDPAPL